MYSYIFTYISIHVKLNSVFYPNIKFSISLDNFFKYAIIYLVILCRAMILNKDFGRMIYMKFKKNISRVLACSLLLSMYNCCVISGTENKNVAENDNKKTDLETALVVYKPPLLQDNDNQLVHSNNQSTQNMNSRSCYICETKDNPHINYVLGENRQHSDEPVEDSNCPICGKFMHPDCWKKFSKMAVEKDKYKEKMSKDLIVNLLTEKTRLCPYCLYNITKQNNSKNENENKKEKTIQNDMEEKKETKEKNQEGITLNKKDIAIAGGALLLTLSFSPRGGNITMNNNNN